VSGADKGKEVVVTGDVFRVGSAPDNELVLTDEAVSRQHFVLLRDPKGFLLRDLGSTNGTRLDASEVKEAYLSVGSVITAGGTQLKVRPFAERIEILPSDKERFGEVVGRSVAMREIFGLLERIA